MLTLCGCCNKIARLVDDYHCEGCWLDYQKMLACEHPRVEDGCTEGYWRPEFTCREQWALRHPNARQRRWARRTSIPF